MSLRTAIRAPRPLAPQRKRRRIVALVAAGWLLMASASLAQLAGWLTLGSFLHGFGLGMGVVTFVMLMMPWKLGLPSLKDSHADERQRGQLLEVYTLAYRVVASVVLVAAMYLLTASDGSLPMPKSHEDWYTVVWGMIILVGALPTAILAWKEPDFDDGGQV